MASPPSLPLTAPLESTCEWAWCLSDSPGLGCAASFGRPDDACRAGNAPFLPAGHAAASPGASALQAPLATAQCAVLGGSGVAREGGECPFLHGDISGAISTTSMGSGSAFVLLPHMPYFPRTLLCTALLLAAPVWTYALVSKLRPGGPRLLAALPALVALLIAPLLFDPHTELLTLMSVAFLSQRLPLTKVGASG